MIIKSSNKMLIMRNVLSSSSVNKNLRRSVSMTSCRVVDQAEQIQSLKPWHEIPGPPSLPMVGPLFSFLPGGNFGHGSGYELLNRMHQLYGPIVRLDGGLGRNATLFLFDPEAVECVLRNEELRPIRPGMESLEYYRKHHNKAYDPDRVTGLISEHGKNWRDFRTTVNPIMMQPKTIQLYNDVMKEVADEMIACMRSMRDENDKITKDFDLKMHLWALESIAVVALGQRLNCFDRHLPADSPTRRLIRSVHDLFQISNEIDFKPNAWKIFSTPTFRKAMKIYEKSDRHGKNWRDFRTTVNPIMMQPKTIQLYNDVMKEVADEMIACMRSMRDENDKITKDFDLKMHLWALESIAVVALGQRLNCFDRHLPADSPTRRLIRSVHDLFQISNEIDFKPNAWKIFSTPTFRKAMKIYEKSDRLTNDFVSQRLKLFEESKKRTSETSIYQKSILEKLLDVDERAARLMASEMLIAGVDTTSNTVLATLYLLAKNPEKQKKLREEVLAKPARVPYLRACIKESMRILPVVLGSQRLSTKEYNLLGYRVPKNVLVTFAHQYMANMEEHYPRPDEFIPERWLVGKDDPLYHGNAHPLAMAPFGFGVRTCIGRRIAELEIRTLISRVLENFHFEWTSNEPLQIVASTVNLIKGPFHFVVKDL